MKLVVSSGLLASLQFVPYFPSPQIHFCTLTLSKLKRYEKTQPHNCQYKTLSQTRSLSLKSDLITYPNELRASEPGVEEREASRERISLWCLLHCCHIGVDSIILEEHPWSSSCEEIFAELAEAYLQLGWAVVGCLPCWPWS